jgi:predicted phosphodiesterase
MKVAILADIHSNLPALQTVVAHIEAWRPDKVLVAGDVINRGPRPAECLHLIQEKQVQNGWQVVRGNHEDYVLDQARPDVPRHGPEFELARNGYWTYRQLNGQVAALKAMPFQEAFTGPDGQEVRVVHASMLGNREGIYPDMPDDELRRRIAPPPAVFCIGHTHRPLIRYIDKKLVVNVGSVGMPFDGDTRAAYGQLLWKNDRWRARIVRLDYDRARTQIDFFETGFIHEAGALATIMLVELRQARAHIHLWSRRYEAVVLSGEISIDDSVRDYLGDQTGRPAR